MINELDKVDYMVLDEVDKSKLILAISDHLDWQFEREHLLLLQEKLVQYQLRKKFEKLLLHFRKALAKQVPDVQIEINYQLVANED